MIIHLDNVMRHGTGPGNFAGRLARALVAQGHAVVTSGLGADVSLVFIEPSGQPLASKVVQRVDGIWFKPNEFQAKNAGIRSLHASADAVVYQSDFDRRMVERWFGPARGPLSCVIRNGVELNPITTFSIAAVMHIREAYRMVYVCSSNWHPQKRLKANIELFERLRNIEPSSFLFVLGSNPDHRVTSPHVGYLGHAPPHVYAEVYSAANWMIHLAWADHCPNVVVEALAQGTPVICSEVGGTKELVGGYGVVLKEAPYDLELADYDSPPPIDTSQALALPAKRDLDHTTIPCIDIQHVARQYVGLFEAVLGE